MSITSNDVLLKFSTKAGTQGNSNPGNAAGSLGKYISQTEIPDNQLHNLFDEITSQENVDLDVEYRCFFVHNSNQVDTFFNVRVFIAAQTAGGADLLIGLDPTAASDLDSVPAQALSVADEDTAPAGVAFSTPTTYDNGLDIGDLAPDEVRAVWCRRQANDSGALANDGATLRIQGESL